ncbi:branched-chain amino acid ABC transporter substrate-binding protein [Herbaspirillum rhizosphaerae]|uniref:branched-chain amino acid ABC transporter substrate-binding protein n=1 Tax=Herbaspirillum rhizosphaerae TaxID=346179 RepID=UPI00067C56D8|nr:branched-chain amino acid ABC transporter substrate-binding protein [Herbaspirillum rhizosphaerae]
MKLIRAASICRALSFSLGIAALLAVALAAHAEDPVKKVTIGFAAPLSGPAGAVGQSQQFAIEMALAEVNAREFRVNGQQIVFNLLVQDDRGDPRAAALVADYLVRSGVVAVIGHWNTGASVVASKIYHAAGIPQIAPGSSGRIYTQAGYKNVFRIIGHDDDGGIYASRFAVQNLRARRVAVIDDDTDFGRMLANQFVKGLSQQGITPVARQSVSSKTSDFNAALNECKAQNADLIFFGGLGPQVATLTHSIRRMTPNSRLLAADGTVGPLFLHMAGADGEGTYALAWGQTQEKMNGWKKFKEKYTALHGDRIELFAPFAYDAANMIFAAIRQADSTDPKRIAATLHAMKYTGLTGVIAFDDEGNLVNPVYTVYQVQQQKWMPVQAFGGR